MSVIFNNNFRTTLASNPGAMAGATIQMYLFPIAPALGGESGEDNLSYAAIDTIAALQTTLGWGPAIPYTVSQTVSVNTTVQPPNSYVMVTQFDLHDSTPTSMVKALVFVYSAGPQASLVGKIIFITNTPLAAGVILNYKDAIVPQPSPAPFVAPNNRWLFGWNTPTGGVPSLVEGPLAVLRGPPLEFQSAKVVHVWLYPQRINMIANPSFEMATNFWRASGAIATANTQRPYGSGSFYGRFTGTSPIKAESNTFPLQIARRSEQAWTIQLLARSDGEIKVGLVTWEADFLRTYVDWGPDGEEWKPNDGWMAIRSVRRIGDVATGMLRLECNGTFLNIDQVCVEPGMLSANGDDWPYFDGSSYYETEGDYSWYGVAHESYSCWYNHRSAVMGRLFSWEIVPEDQRPSGIITDEEVIAQGLVYQWVPAGVLVTPHYDVLYPGDPKSPLSPVSGSVLPYGGNQGITSPW